VIYTGHPGLILSK